MENTPLNQQTLLHLDTRPKGWSRWFAAQGMEIPRDSGMQFDQFATMAQAAVHGLGVALLPTFVADPYLQGGLLELAAPDRQDSIGSYFLVWPEHRTQTGALRAFRHWLARIAPPAPAQSVSNSA